METGDITILVLKYLIQTNFGRRAVSGLQQPLFLWLSTKLTKK